MEDGESYGFKAAWPRAKNSSQLSRNISSLAQHCTETIARTLALKVDLDTIARVNNKVMEAIKKDHPEIFKKYTAMFQEEIEKEPAETASNMAIVMRGTTGHPATEDEHIELDAKDFISIIQKMGDRGEKGE